MVRSAAIAAGAIVVVASALFLPLEMPYCVEERGRVLALKEWVLTRGEDGRIIASLRDNLRATVEGFEVAAFERGDRVTFKLHPDIAEGAVVDVGDTVAVIYSSETERQCSRLRGELSSELASLAVYQTGEKEPAVREAELNVAHAQRQIEHQETQVARLRELLDRQMIPTTDLQEAENLLTLHRISLERAGAQLIAIRTGAKEQELAWRRARVSAARDELAVLERRLRDSTFTSPLAGRVTSSASPGAIVAVHDTTGTIVVLLAKWSDRGAIGKAERVEIRRDGSADILVGSILHLGGTARTLAGRQCFEVRVLVADGGPGLAPGLAVRAAIVCEPVRLLEYLRRVLLS